MACLTREGYRWTPRKTCFKIPIHLRVRRGGCSTQSLRRRTRAIAVSHAITTQRVIGERDYRCLLGGLGWAPGARVAPRVS